jgi:hypothetical protein
MPDDSGKPNRELEFWMFINETKEAILKTEGSQRNQFNDELEELYSEIYNRYGVIAPHNCPEPQDGVLPDPPDGKQFYWGWHTLMNDIAFHMKQELTICSACEFFLPKTESICCRVFPGTMVDLIPNNYTCAMVKFGHWTEESLLHRIQEEGRKRGVNLAQVIITDPSSRLTEDQKRELEVRAGNDEARKALVKFRAKEEALRLISAHLHLAAKPSSSP